MKQVLTQKQIEEITKELLKEEHYDIFWEYSQASFLNALLVELTTPTGKPVGFSLPSVARNRTSFSDFGIRV